MMVKYIMLRQTDTNNRQMNTRHLNNNVPYFFFFFFLSENKQG